MMKRKDFIKNTAAVGIGLSAGNISRAAAPAAPLPEVRVKPAARNFRSEAVDNAIKIFQQNVKNKELAWLFNNCFPNTLDTTVFYSEKNGRPDTYVITGDIDAMWLRDSSAQVFPYLPFAKEDASLHNMIKGVIYKQTHFILKDPYANAFYNDDAKESEWKKDLTKMQPGIHERKYEIDSLCYPIRLAYHFWKVTGDTAPFDSAWKSGIAATLKVFKEQQRKNNDGPYTFQRETAWATDGVPMAGYGYPVNPVGLICSLFRPSDDATIFPFLIPSNMFAVVSLRQASEMVRVISRDNALAGQLMALAAEVDAAVKKYGYTRHPKYGNIISFETNGYWSYNLMDDANVPSLLGLPYLGCITTSDPVYLNTRKFVWSLDNPFFFKGKAAEGIGGPHIGKDMIWPMSIIIKGLTSNDDIEIKNCIQVLQKCHGGTGFMHESFNKDNPAKFTRKWFAWANTLFGELLWKTYTERKHLLV